jgi:hypothetical protein
MTPPLAEQVTRASNLLGLLLGLVTLFTAEVAQRLAGERRRIGGADEATVRSARLIAGGLAVVTVGAVVALLPLLWDVLAAIGDDNWEPVLSVFPLAWVLLCGLAVWQVRLTIRAP